MSPVHSYMENVKEFKQLLMTRIDTTKMGKLFLKDCLGGSGDMFLKKRFLIIELFVLFE